MPHTPSYASDIRTLAQKFAAGRISWAEYREQRTARIAATVRGDEPLVYRPFVRFSDTPLPGETPSEAIIDLGDFDTAAPRRWPAVIAVVVLGAVVTVAGWAVWRSMQPPVVASAPVVQMSPAEGVLHRFLTVDEWTASAMMAAVSDWEERPIDERVAARGTPTWRRLQQQLRERIRQQEVLASVDESGEALAQERRLRAFDDALAR